MASVPSATTPIVRVASALVSALIWVLLGFGSFAGAASTTGVPCVGGCLGFNYDSPTDVASSRGAQKSPSAVPAVNSGRAVAHASIAVPHIYDQPANLVAPSAARHLCSFSGETEVLMADGTTKPISEVQVGDRVLAEDPETGERGAREVTHLWAHQDTIIDLGIVGHDVATTEDHPFWNATDNEWQRADNLDAGDLLLTADGAMLTVDGLDWGSARTTTAYNLTVDSIHTYFVEVDGHAVLVHNVCDNAWDIAHKSFGDHDIPGISSIDELATYVDDVMRGPGYDIPGSDGLRRAWWDNDRGVVVISDLTTSWSPGSVYRPDDGYAYFRRLIEGDL